MKKHYFDLDKVDSITLTRETETSWRWMPTIPARPKTFLGIRYGMESEIPAGWNDNFYDNGNEKYPWHRHQSSYFDDYKWYKVTPFRIYNKAHVEIRLGYKQSFGVNFESTDEAQLYVDELIKSSDKKFNVIINN